MASFMSIPSEVRSHILEIRMRDEFNAKKRQLPQSDEDQSTESQQKFLGYSVYFWDPVVSPHLCPLGRELLLTSRQLYMECADVFGRNFQLDFDSLKKPDLNDRFLESKTSAFRSEVRHIKITLPPFVLGPTVKRQFELLQEIRDRLPNIQTLEVVVSSWVLSERRSTKLLGLWARLLQPLRHVEKVNVSTTDVPSTRGMNNEKRTEQYHTPEELAPLLSDKIQKVRQETDETLTSDDEFWEVDGVSWKLDQTIAPIDVAIPNFW